jgi:MFS family permease
VKLPNGFKWFLYSILTLAFISGGLWFAFDHWVRVQGPLGEDHSPAQAWFLRVHGILAYAILLGLGYMIRAHVQPGLKGKRGKTTGLPMTIYFGILIISAIIQLYGTDGPFRDVTASVHAYMGLALPVLLITHIVMARRRVEVKVPARVPLRRIFAAMLVLGVILALRFFI